MNRFVILLGGYVTPTPRLLGQVTNARVIAADGGMSHAQELGLIPELWVGDFDSSSAELQAQFSAIPREQYPSDKALTDGEIAVEAALKRGAEEIVFVGSAGGQSDHSFFHSILALRLRQSGTKVFCTTGIEEIYPLIPGNISVLLEGKKRFSVVGITDLKSLTLKGAKWPTNALDVKFGQSRTVSNESTGPISVELESGLGLLFCYPI